MLKPLFAASMLLLVFVAPVKAATTIEAYMPSCEAAISDPNDPMATACLFYIGGVSDVFTSHMLDWPVCAPEGTTTMDVVETFVVWANQHPDVWQEDIYRGVMAALSERYRC